MLHSHFKLAGLLLLLSASTVATSATSTTGTPIFSSHPSISRTGNCFEGPFKSHQSFQEFLQQKNQDKPFYTRWMLNFAVDKDDFNRYQQQLDCQNFVYQVDGVPVRGLMIKPKQHQGKLPILIYNRGGNGGFGSLNTTFALKRLMPWAERGYLVIASNYRGEHNWGKNQPATVGHDEFGGAEVNDIRALWPILQQSPAADTERAAMYGVSRGGMMTFLAAKTMPQLKAVIVSAGVSDLAHELKFRPGMEKSVYAKRIPDYQNRKAQALAERSVVNFIDQIPAKLPILLLHGSADERVHVSNAEQLAKLLQQHNHPHKLVIYPGDDHGLRNHRAAADAEVAAWLETYLN